LAGILARDVDIRFTSTGKKVASTTICVAVSSKTRTFIRLVGWEGVAEALEQVRQGDFLELRGRIQSRSWDAPDGKRVITEVVVNNVAISTDDVTNTRMEAGENDSITF